MPRSTALFRNKAELKTRLGEVPACAGVYRFYDVDARIVYVGKSICLRDRVRSYFTGRAATKKLRRMRAEVSSLDWQETGSELEALLLESRLVKQHQPRFNVMLREFIPLPYVRVDLRDPFPRLEVTRAPDRDGAAYFGPFRSYVALEAGVKALSDALQLRDCDGPGEKLRETRPCYRHEFGTCAGPCLDLITAEEYRALVDRACAALEGESVAVIETIRGRMERAAERMQFEIAARLRDAIRHIQAVTGRQHALVSALGELSLVAACPSRTGEQMLLFVFRTGRMVATIEVATAELRQARYRAQCARRLVKAWAAAPELQGTRLDSAVLDEVQIITGWMKQKTREGAYWQFPREMQPKVMTAALSDWLAEQAFAAEHRKSA